MQTEAIESDKVKYIPKNDLKNLKVAIIGVKLL
jgi:hypothetical protein